VPKTLGPLGPLTLPPRWDQANHTLRYGYAFGKDNFIYNLTVARSISIDRAAPTGSQFTSTKQIDPPHSVHPVHPCSSSIFPLYSPGRVAKQENPLEPRVVPGGRLLASVLTQSVFKRSVPGCPGIFTPESLWAGTAQAVGPFREGCQSPRQPAGLPLENRTNPSKTQCFPTTAPEIAGLDAGFAVRPVGGNSLHGVPRRRPEYWAPRRVPLIRVRAFRTYA
jgi:hypothetical protein